MSWWKDGRPVDTHKNRRLLVKSHSNSSLAVIRKVKLSDGGDYSCVASNLVGRRESAIIKLNVYGEFTTGGEGVLACSKKRIILFYDYSGNLSTIATLGTEENGY